MTELRKQINNIVEDHQACLTLAKSMNGNEVYEGTTATAEDIVMGKTAYSNGELITGSKVENDSNTTLHCNTTSFVLLNSISSITNLSLPNVTSINNGFRDCRGLKTVSLTNLDKVQNIASMFWNCANLKEVNLYVPNVTNMYGTFWNCYNLRNLVIEGGNNITNYCSVFLGCNRLTDAPYMNTSKANSFFQLYMNCASLVNIPILDTSNVTNLGNMVRFCNMLSDESLDNILVMCSKAKSDPWKTLNSIGMTNTLGYRCQRLPHYNDFVNAGWSLGYR